MSRSVVLAGTARCGECLLPPRWCLCGALPPVATPLQVDVLLHHREQWRPSSTGLLVRRAVAGARAHAFDRHLRPRPEGIVMPGRELWVLHPQGAPLESVVRPGQDLGRVQVLLLDGSWNEAAGLLKTVTPWGRAVSLRLPGVGRYRLREQKGEGRLSTAEALAGLYGALGLHAAESLLRLHFELLVYAGLRSRGRVEEASRFLDDSPVRDALPDFLARLHEPRPNTETARPRAGRTGEGDLETRPTEGTPGTRSVG